MKENYKKQATHLDCVAFESMISSLDAKNRMRGTGTASQAITLITLRNRTACWTVWRQAWLYLRTVLTRQTIRALRIGS